LETCGRDYLSVIQSIPEEDAKTGIRVAAGHCGSYGDKITRLVAIVLTEICST
jgi:hypothetical protein